MFENSQVVDDCELTYLHVFPFSPRKGTPSGADAASGSRRRRGARGAELRAKGLCSAGELLDEHFGSEVELLAEQNCIGRTRQFAEMRLPAEIAAGSIGAGARQWA